MTRATAFNKSPFGRWINSPSGRTFRALAGIGFLLLGWDHRDKAAGKVSMVWGLLPLSAGVADVCYISASLGGPLRGSECRR